MKVKIADQAKADLSRIGDWIAQENPARAISFVDEILLECLSLGSFPQKYVVYKSTDVGMVRRKPYGNYLIFYAIVLDTIIVTRILHGAQDYSDLF
jgi:toxin ParE1/3/4